MKYVIPAVFAVFLASALMLPADASASPWTKSTGEYFLQLGTQYYHASEYRDGSGNIRDDASYTSLTTSTYGELGVWDDLHVQFSLPVVAAWAEHAQGEFSEVSLGDTFLSLQASPVELGVPTSIRLETKLPLYGRPDDPGAPAAGDHQVDLSAFLSVGGGLHHLEIPAYFYVDAGYTHRTRFNFDAQVPGRDFSDAFTGRIEAGYTVADTFDVGMGSSAVLPFDADPARDEAYITVGPSVFAPLNERIAVDANGYFTPYSRNAGAGWALIAGVSVFNDEH